MGRLKEVVHPNFECPDMGDPLTWALFSRLHADWTREVAPQIGIDGEKLVLGQIISSIIGDDKNCFEFAKYDFLKDNPEVALGAKAQLLERMDWELTAPETPEEIQEQIKETMEFVFSCDWRIEKDFEEARDRWMQFREWAEGLIDDREDLRVAFNYSLVSRPELNRLWQEFLFG